jgi:hypothetical protein
MSTCFCKHHGCYDMLHVLEVNFLACALITWNPFVWDNLYNTATCYLQRPVQFSTSALHSGRLPAVCYSYTGLNVDVCMDAFILTTVNQSYGWGPGTSCNFFFTLPTKIFLSQYNRSNLNKSCFDAQWIGHYIIYLLIKALYEQLLLSLMTHFRVLNNTVSYLMNTWTMNTWTISLGCLMLLSWRFRLQCSFGPVSSDVFGKGFWMLVPSRWVVLCIVKTLFLRYTIPPNGSTVVLLMPLSITDLGVLMANSFASLGSWNII